MTLNEIYKIIDESDILIFKKENKRVFIVIRSQESKDNEKSQAENDIKTGHTLIFLKLNDNNDVEKKWLVDHIDKEKKIIKKKLDDMTQEEINKVSARICFGNTCQECPFVDNNDFKCLDDFLDWKKRYLDNKDKEFEIEVEDEKEN